MLKLNSVAPLVADPLDANSTLCINDNSLCASMHIPLCNHVRRNLSESLVQCAQGEGAGDLMEKHDKNRLSEHSSRWTKCYDQKLPRGKVSLTQKKLNGMLTHVEIWHHGSKLKKNVCRSNKMFCDQKK